jgi:hypothetical protein
MQKKTSNLKAVEEILDRVIDRTTTWREIDAWKADSRKTSGVYIKVTPKPSPGYYSIKGQPK